MTPMLAPMTTATPAATTTAKAETMLMIAMMANKTIITERMMIAVKRTIDDLIVVKDAVRPTDTFLSMRGFPGSPTSPSLVCPRN